MKFFTVVLAATTLFAANVWAKKSADLSAFLGAYNGKGSIVASGTVAPMTAKVKFDVAKNGRSGKAVISGIITFEGNAIPWGTTLTFKRSGKLITSNILAVNQGGPVFIGRGKFNPLKSSKIKGNTSLSIGGDTAMQIVSLTVKPKGKKKTKLDLDIRVVVNGIAFASYKANLIGR